MKVSGRGLDGRNYLRGLVWHGLFVTGRTLEQQRVGVEHAVFAQMTFHNGLRLVLEQVRLGLICHDYIDGLRVDAVASMLYLDYSRGAGEWIPNPYGGRENIEAIDFLRAMNDTVHAECPGVVTIAEESTAWGGVSRPTSIGGLGFTFKWNMGWMHDTLAFFRKEPVHRKHHMDQLTFSMMYEYTERFVNSISHDEVVHGKRSLIEKLPGDLWQKFANLRLLLAYQFTRPGKQLMFMGVEIAQHGEWYHEVSLDWHLNDDPRRLGLQRFIAELNALYRRTPCLWRADPNPESFEWIDFDDRDNTTLSYLRREGDAHVVVVLNLTPVPRDDYLVGVPRPGRYLERLSSDDGRFGGSDTPTLGSFDSQPVPFHHRSQSIRLRLPPLGALVLSAEI